VVITQTNAPNLPDATKTRFTPDEYRAIEETAEERHEYCNGEILAISRGSEVHRAIACNLMSLPIDSDDRVVWRLAQSKPNDSIDRQSEYEGRELSLHK
jgi:Uma2 family endonuclease